MHAMWGRATGIIFSHPSPKHTEQARFFLPLPLHTTEQYTVCQPRRLRWEREGTT